MSDLLDEKLDLEAPEEQDCKLSNPVSIPGEDEAFSMISGEWNQDVIQRMTKQAAEKLNLGLLISTLDIIIDTRRTREKIKKLEDAIYTESGISCDRDLIALYNSEKSTLSTQIETVRKYVLNNKSALDELDKPIKELVDILTQLPADKISSLRSMLDDMRSDDMVNKQDLLESL